MARRFVRLKCELVRGPSRAYTYVFDLVIEDDKIVQGWDYLGFSKFRDNENRGATEVYPFIVDEDGEIDFGSAYETADRFLSTNLLSKHIRVSETFTVNDAGENVYVIREVNGI